MLSDPILPMTQRPSSRRGRIGVLLFLLATTTEVGMPSSLQTRPSPFAMPFPSACLAPPFYVLFSFIWLLPLRPPHVACWAVTEEARFSKGIDTRTFFSASNCSCSQRPRTHPFSSTRWLRMEVPGLWMQVWVLLLVAPAPGSLSGT